MRSLIESFIDVGSGFLLATLLQLLIFPVFGLYPSLTDSAGIATYATNIKGGGIVSLQYQSAEDVSYFLCF